MGTGKNSFLASILASVMLFAALVTSPKAAAEGLQFAVYSSAENTCLDVKDYSTAPGAIVQTFTCTGASNQLWNASVIGYAQDGTMAMRLVNVGSGLCLDLTYASTNAGVGALQAPCTGSATQTWKYAGPATDVGRPLTGTLGYLDSQPAVFRQLVNAATGLCLQPGLQVTQQVCSAQTKWRMPIF